MLPPQSLTNDIILPDQDELLLTQFEVRVHEAKLAVQDLEQRRSTSSTGVWQVGLQRERDVEVHHAAGLLGTATE